MYLLGLKDIKLYYLRDLSDVRIEIYAVMPYSSQVFKVTLYIPILILYICIIHLRSHYIIKVLECWLCIFYILFA